MRLDNLPSLAEVQEELRRRELARFAPWARPEFQYDVPHLRYLIEHLQAFADGKIQNLMISMPPQHGKTETSNVLFAVWLLTSRVGLRMAMATYNQQHANKISRNTRRLLEAVGGKLAGDAGAVEEWETASGNTYRAVGFGAGLSGYAVDIGVIDDPYKDREEADSKGIRESRWEWYTDVWLARNIQQQLFVGTEWHEDGLHARIRNSAQAHRWTCVRLPAIALEDDPLGRAVGDPLWPDRCSLETLLERRADNPRSFEALYQQNPTPREGALFRVGSLAYCDPAEAPKDLPMVRRWDMAASTGGDYTAGVLLAGPCPAGRWYVVDVVRGRWEPHERYQVVRQTAERDGRRVRIIGPQDPGQAGVTDGAMFIKLLAGFSASIERETGSKELRAEPVAAQVNGGNVVLVRAAWNGDFVEELRTFPGGRNDDQVDALSGAFNHLALGKRPSLLA